MQVPDEVAWEEEVYEDEDDENAESNWRNDYPDEEYSEDECEEERYGGAWVRRTHTDQHHLSASERMRFSCRNAAFIPPNIKLFIYTKKFHLLSSVSASGSLFLSLSLFLSAPPHFRSAGINPTPRRISVITLCSVEC